GRADDVRDLRRNDVTVRMHRDEKAATLEREADTPARRCGAGCGAKTERFAFELEELLGVDFAAELLDAFEDATLGCRELFDLLGELWRIAKDFPCGLER